MTDVGEWIESFLTQVEQRSLHALKRKGIVLKDGNLVLGKHALIGTVAEARSAYINCGLVRDSVRTGNIDGAVLAAIRAMNGLWIAEGGNALIANAKKGAAGKLARDPKQPVMAQIRAEFKRWQAGEVRYRNDADFAKKMHAKHGALIDNEGSIKNACTRWRKAKNHRAS